MVERNPDPTRSESILDAILDKVVDEPTPASSRIFRAQALAQIDVAAEIDNQLPLVPRRNWLLLVGAACVVVGFLLWAAVTPSATTITGPALTVAAPGLLPVASLQAGTIADVGVRPGDDVLAGEPIATLAHADGPDSAVTSPISGRVWQVFAQPGAIAPSGTTLVTLLPRGSAESALVVVPAAATTTITPGQEAVADGMRVGAVEAISPPLNAYDAGARIGATLPAGDYAVVTVRRDAAREPGTTGDIAIVVSAGTVLSRLVGR